MAIIETHKPVTLTQREIAVVVAKAISRGKLQVPSGKYRNDVDGIQIDPIILEKRVTNPRKGVRLQFMAENDLGVCLNIDLEEFAQNPQAYLHEQFDHLGRMLRNSVKMRRNQKLFNSAVNEILQDEGMGYA